MPIQGYFDKAFGVDGSKTAVPDAVQPDGTVSYDQGYTPPYQLDPANPSALLIDRAQFNQILFDITSAIQYAQQNGASPFITTTMNGGISPYSYNLGAIASYDAGSGVQNWISVVGANTDTPGASAKWQPLGASTGVVFTGENSGGTANAQTITTTQGNFELTDGNIVSFTAGISNLAATTLAIDAIAATTIKKATQSGLVDLVAGDIVSTQKYLAIVNGSILQLINPSSLTNIVPVSAAVNLRASITGASATATWTATQIAVASAAGGIGQTLASFSQAVNLGTTGAGGMDNGSAPNNSFVCLYAIAKADGTKNILAADIANSSGAIYSGGHMPAGYRDSSLVGVWPTNGSGQFIPGIQVGRKVSFASTNVLNVTSSVPTSYTSASLSAIVPANAISFDGCIGNNTTSSVQTTAAIAADGNGLAEKLWVVLACLTSGNLSGFTQAGSFSGMPLITAQTVYYKSLNSGDPIRLNVTGYNF